MNRSMDRRTRPTPADLVAAVHRRVPDVLAPDLKLLFVGINPGLYSAWMRRHFARPGNRFWTTLHAAGFTPRLFHPLESDALLDLGLGLTNIVSRASRGELDLRPDELAAGGRTLLRKIRKYRPRCVAILGVRAYALAFNVKKPVIGPQSQTLAGVPLWLLPNPSGLNAHFPPKKLVVVFRRLRMSL